MQINTKIPDILNEGIQFNSLTPLNLNFIRSFFGGVWRHWLRVQSESLGEDHCGWVGNRCLDWQISSGQPYCVLFDDSFLKGGGVNYRAPPCHSLFNVLVLFPAQPAGDFLEMSHTRTLWQPFLSSSPIYTCYRIGRMMPKAFIIRTGIEFRVG